VLALNPLAELGSMMLFIRDVSPTTVTGLGPSGAGGSGGSAKTVVNTTAAKRQAIAGAKKNFVVIVVWFPFEKKLVEIVNNGPGYVTWI